LANIQPLFAEIGLGRVAVAHNGNLINAEKLRYDLIKSGAIFGSSVDTEVILHLLSRGKDTQPLIENVIAAVKEVKGAYSLLLLFRDRMLAIRDPNGFRPLALGRLGNGIVAASET